VKKDEVTDLISSLLEDKSEDDLFRVVEDLNERQLSMRFRRTLCRGNRILKNIMFKCDQEVPRIFICDALQVMLFNTNEDFLQHYFHSLLAHYHNWLKEELEKY
jgi:hypothetical protein